MRLFFKNSVVVSVVANIVVSYFFCSSMVLSSIVGAAEISSTENNQQQTVKTALPNYTYPKPVVPKVTLGFKDFISSFFFLLLILLSIFAFAWFVKRMGLSQGGGNQLIKIISTVAVGQKEKISLIEVGDQQILVGISPGNIQKIIILEHPLKADAITQSQQLSGFASQLSKYFNEDKKNAK